MATGSYFDPFAYTASQAPNAAPAPGPADTGINPNPGLDGAISQSVNGVDPGSTAGLLAATRVYSAPRPTPPTPPAAGVGGATPGVGQTASYPAATGSGGLAPAEQRIINWESGGNPNAVNNWDANAKAGNASTGIGQLTGTNRDFYGKQAGLQPSQYRDNNYADQLAETRAYIEARYGAGGKDPYAQALQNALNFHISHGWY